MPAIFIHVSDIHFGQEKDDALHINNDVKEQLIADAAAVVAALPGKAATGILVTGDIAQAGRRTEYDEAGAWLDRLAKAVRCEVTEIQMVPGNHDLDRTRSSQSLEHLLPKLRSGGAREYEAVLSNAVDRAALYERFADYMKFAEGYNCPLDPHGKFTEKAVELAPGRWIRFVRMNSSLLCTKDDNDQDPQLFIGNRQFCDIPRVKGEENVVLIHHPLNWFKDAEDAKRYIRSRSRVLITGHEHFPKVTVDQVEPGCDVMVLAAGATTPYRSNGAYTYTYNVLVFDWDRQCDALSVHILPRAWNGEFTRFDADDIRLGGKDPRFVLQSPNFRAGAVASLSLTTEAAVDDAVDALVAVAKISEVPIESPPQPAVKMEATVQQYEPSGYRLVLLRFFRDLGEAERLSILIELSAVPPDFDDTITHNVQRVLLDQLCEQGSLDDLAHKIEQRIQARTQGNSK